MLDWSIYLIRNRFNALYCGVTNDVERRFLQHCEGKGAKALKGKGPLYLVWCQSGLDKSTALKAECYIKSLHKTQKEALVSAQARLIAKTELTPVKRVKFGLK